MLVALLEAYLQSGYELCPEFLLTRLPQRIDVVIIEKTSELAGKPRWIHSILDYLGAHTLIEHKGPTDKLMAEDALVLAAYAAQYMRLRKIANPATVMLMVVADRMSAAFVKRIERLEGSLAKFDAGLWRGKLLAAPSMVSRPARPTSATARSGCSTRSPRRSSKIRGRSHRWIATRRWCITPSTSRWSSFAETAESLP